MKSLLIVLIALGAVACQEIDHHVANAQADTAPPCVARVPFQAGLASRAQYGALKQHLESLYLSGRPRREDYQPAAVLPRVHPWFAGNLCKRTLGKSISYELPPVPGSVIEDLELIAGGEAKNGIAILNVDFWKNVREIQNKGLRVSFLRSAADFEVAGLYHSDTEQISFDIYANPGTAHHEYRHHLQHLVLPRPYPHLTLADRCAHEASRFLAELDATTSQLRFWVGTFDGLPTSENASLEELRITMNPQVTLIDANLNYPGLASRWLKNANCPSDLESAAKRIAQRTDSAKAAIVSTVRKLTGVSASLVHSLIAYRQSCPAEANPPAPTCATDLESVQQKAREGERLKSEVNNLLRQESVERARYQKDILLKLPQDIRADLHRLSGAFRLMMEASH